MDAGLGTRDLGGDRGMAESHERGERGLTPVVGIALLIALTLLLAATVTAFALGIEDDRSSDRVPTVAVDFEFDRNAGVDDGLTIVHKSGEAIAAESLLIVIDGATCTGDDPTGRYAATLWTSGSLTAGGAIDVDGDAVCSGGSDLDLSGAIVQVVWNPESGTSTLLGTWHGPA